MDRSFNVQLANFVTILSDTICVMFTSRFSSYAISVL